MTCTGNLPNRYATQVWLCIQSEIELAQHSNQSLSGVVIDLVKAFNLLPRLPIITLMDHFGIPKPILRAWSLALVAMQRRFKLRNCVGPSVKSSTGFAEGDALSVTAMLTTNIVCHKWMSFKHPSVTLWSYVDNIECTAPNAQETEASLGSLKSFTEAMDVLIDSDKTFVWSVQAEERRQLKQNRLTIKHSARDLGGHMQYTGQATNYTVLDRCKAMLPIWNRLSRSLAGYTQKVRAVRAKAWPHCLHGSTITHIGDENFDSLRTGCMQGLKVAHAGTSPLAHLSLIENALLDPQFHTIVKTFNDFRAMMDPNITSYVMQSLQHDPRLRPPPGPCSVLLTRARQIGWEWSRETTFNDQMQRPINIMTCAPQELMIRLKQAWQDRVKAILAQRKTMKGMQWTSPDITNSELASMSPDEAAILRVSLNGTFFTTDHAVQQGRSEINKCPFCPADDSQIHRHWFCEAFQEQRSHLTHEQVTMIQTLDPCVSVHGWIPEPPSVRKLQTMLQELPPLDDIFQWPRVMPETLHCFTDGGCLSPANPLHRVATWGIALANMDCQTFQPLANGVVRGTLQTAVRGEICAAIQACRFAALAQRPVVLWVDNDLVFKRIKKYHKYPRCFKPNQKDVDLWMHLHDNIRQLGHLFVTVLKVVSHQSQQGAMDDFEEWVFQGNSAADAIAESSLYSYPTLVEQWARTKHEVGLMHQLRRGIHQTIVQIGMRAVKDKPTTTTAERKPRLTEEDLSVVSLSFEPSLEVPLRYRVDRLGAFLRWLSTLEHAEAPAKLVSWFELNTIFEDEFSTIGFRYNQHSKRWYLPVATTEHHTFVRRANSLASFIRGLMQVTGRDCRVLHIRPNSDVVSFWTQCISIRFTQQRKAKAEALLRMHQPTFHSVKQLRTI